MDVLPTYAVYGTSHITAREVRAAKMAWRSRLERLFAERRSRQNGGDYPDGHVLADHVAAGQSGLTAHVAEESPGAVSLERARAAIIAAVLSASCDPGFVRTTPSGSQ